MPVVTGLPRLGFLLSLIDRVIDYVITLNMRPAKVVEHQSGPDRNDPTEDRMAEGHTITRRRALLGALGAAAAIPVAAVVAATPTAAADKSRLLVGGRAVEVDTDALPLIETTDIDGYWVTPGTDDEYVFVTHSGEMKVGCLAEGYNFSHASRRSGWERMSETISYRVTVIGKVTAG